MRWCERVAVGRTAAGFDQAVGVRSRQEWYRHKMSRKQLVDISSQRVQAGWQPERREVLVEGQEVWEEWMGQLRRHLYEGRTKNLLKYR